MRLKTSTMIGLAGLFYLAVPARTVSAADFQPRVGEPVKIWHHAIKPGHMVQAQAFFRDTLMARLKADNMAADDYFLVNEKENEILVVSFWGKTDVNSQPHAGVVVEGMKAHSTKTRWVVDHTLVLTNDESLVPQVGDKVVVMSRKVKPGKMEDAKRALRDVVFPHLANDEFTRNSYVLENTAGNELVSLVFMRGDFKEVPELSAKKEKHLRPHLSAEKITEYTLFSIVDE